MRDVGQVQIAQLQVLILNLQENLEGCIMLPFALCISKRSERRARVHPHTHVRAQTQAQDCCPAVGLTYKTTLKYRRERDYSCSLIAWEKTLAWAGLSNCDGLATAATLTLR